MRSYIKAYLTTDSNTGLTLISPFGADIDLVGITRLHRLDLIDGLNVLLQFVKLDCYVPASPPTDPPILAQTIAPNAFLFGNLFPTFNWPDHPKN
jgi:hypothetical protein